MARTTRKDIDFAVTRFCNTFGLKTGVSPGYVALDVSAGRYSLDLKLKGGGQRPLVCRGHMKPTAFVDKMDAMCEGVELFQTNECYHARFERPTKADAAKAIQ